MRKTFNWILILSCFSFGCQKQSPDSINSDYIDSISEVRRGDACQKTTLAEDVFEYENTINLFICTTWDKKFPKMFNSLKKVKKEEWNHLLVPINDNFINDEIVRDRVVSLVSELDRKGGLEDLSQVIVALSDSNFFQHTYNLIKCSGPESDCTNRVGVEELNRFFQFFLVEKDVVSSLGRFFAATSFAFRGDGFSLLQNFKKNLTKEDFVLKRNEFFNQLAIDLGRESAYEEIQFYKNLIQDEGELGWFPRFFRNNIVKNEAIKLIRFPIDTQPSMWKDIRLLKKMLKLSLPCQEDKKGNDFSVLINKHMDSFLEILFRSSHEDFVSHTIQSILLLKGAAQACSNLQSYSAKVPSIGTRGFFRHEINFLKSLEETSSFLSNDYAYYFVKKLNDSHPKGRKDHLFLLDFFAKDSFASGIDLLRETTSDSGGLSGSLYDFIKSFPDNGYTEIFNLLNFIHKKDEKDLRAFSAIWNALGENGRYFVFNALDAHFQKKTNVPLMFDFYNAFLENSAESISKVSESYFSQMRIDRTISSFEEVFGKFSSDDLLAEFRIFFSRDHLLEIVRLLGTGQLPSESLVSLSDFYIAKSPGENQGTLLEDELFRGLIANNKDVACFKSLSKSDITFFSLLRKIPEVCEEVRAEDPLLDIFLSINSFTKDFGSQNTNYSPGPDGLFGGESIRLLTAALKEVDNSFTLFKVLQGFSSWSGKDNIRENLIGLLSLIESVNKGNKGNLLDDFIKFYSSRENFPYMKAFVEMIPSTMNDYLAYKRNQFELTKKTYRKDSRYECSDYHKNIGSIPCPDPSELKVIYQRSLRFLLKKNDNNPTALDQLIKMVSVDFGLPIPFESKSPRYKRVTVTETFKTLYDLTNKSVEINRETVEYNPVPLALKDYFENDNWEVTRDQGKDTPDEFNVKLTTMERIETVIRDVRFDKNYLGAHYLNAVAKAEDYNDTVDKKFTLLKTCIPLKFCGKFMNRAQHKLGKNSKATFKALLDVNTLQKWRYGDYMQSLLTSLVSSSPDKSQVSSIVRRRFLGINLDIPWLQRKKDLESHNGQILGLVTMVNGFTNGARVIRDRVGRTDSEFKRFLEKELLKHLDNNLFRNYQTSKHLKKTEDVLKLVDSSGFLDNVLLYFSEAPYNRVRLAEQIIYKGIYLSSFVGKENLDRRYKYNSIFDVIGLVNPLLNNHKIISKVLNFNDENFLLKVNYLLDVLMVKLTAEDKGNIYTKLLNEFIFYATAHESQLVEALNYQLQEEERAQKFLDSLTLVDDVLELIYTEGDIEKTSDVFSVLLSSNKVDWTALREIIALSSAKEYCRSSICISNSKEREVQNFINFLIKDKGENLFKALDYFKGENSKKVDDLFTKVFPSLILE